MFALAMMGMQVWRPGAWLEVRVTTIFIRLGLLGLAGVLLFMMAEARPIWAESGVVGAVLGIVLAMKAIHKIKFQEQLKGLSYSVSRVMTILPIGLIMIRYLVFRGHVLLIPGHARPQLLYGPLTMLLCFGFIAFWIFLYIAIFKRGNQFLMALNLK